MGVGTPWYGYVRYVPLRSITEVQIRMCTSVISVIDVLSGYVNYGNYGPPYPLDVDSRLVPEYADICIQMAQKWHPDPLDVTSGYGNYGYHVRDAMCGHSIRIRQLRKFALP